MQIKTLIRQVILLKIIRTFFDLISELCRIVKYFKFGVVQVKYF